MLDSVVLCPLCLYCGYLLLLAPNYQLIIDLSSSNQDQSSSKTKDLCTGDQSQICLAAKAVYFSVFCWRSTCRMSHIIKKKKKDANTVQPWEQYALFQSFFSHLNLHHHPVQVCHTLLKTRRARISW